MKKAVFYTIGIFVLVFLIAGTYLWQNKRNGNKNNSATISTTSTTQSQNKLSSTTNQSTTNLCENSKDGKPIITSLSSLSGKIGDNITVYGCNLTGFEGEHNLIIKNANGFIGFIYGKNEQKNNTNDSITVTLMTPLCQEDNSYSGLPCQNKLDLTPGNYSIYTNPWGKKSNEVEFIITE